MPEIVAGDETVVDETIEAAGGTNESTPGSAEAGKPDTAQEDGKPKDLTEAVSAALLGQKPEPSSSSKEEKSEEDESTEGKAEDEGKASGNVSDDDLSEADLQRLNAKTRKRITGLVSRVKELSAEQERLKPAAESFAKVQAFVEKAGLNGDEVNAGFEIMSLMKNDPDTAYDKLLPIFVHLANIVGAGQLPDDLAEDVRLGNVTPERARELGRARARVNLSKHRDTTRQTAEQTAAQQAAQQAQSQEVGSAITAWETQWKSTDADYAKKSERVKDKLVLALTERRNKGEQVTAASAKALLDGILKAVNAEIKALLPAPRQIGNRPNPTGNSGQTAAPTKPKSLEDVIGRALLA